MILSKRWNIPNLLTFIRMALIPIIVIIFYLPFKSANYFCAIVFFLAGITDYLDGMLARKLGQTTRFGAFIDPVADKLMVVISLALFVEEFHSFLVTIPSLIIIGREIVVSALREWMAELGKRNSLAVNLVGKIKTTMQMSSIFMLFLTSGTFVNWIYILALIALYIAAILTLISMLVYLKNALKNFSLE